MPSLLPSNLHFYTICFLRRARIFPIFFHLIKSAVRARARKWYRKNCGKLVQFLAHVFRNCRVGRSRARWTFPARREFESRRIVGWRRHVTSRYSHMRLHKRCTLQRARAIGVKLDESWIRIKREGETVRTPRCHFGFLNSFNLALHGVGQSCLNAFWAYGKYKR